MAGEKEKHQFEELSNKIIGAAIEVHRVLGPGFLESIYEQALKIEAPRSKLRGIFDRKEVCYFSDSLANPAASCGECARFCGSIL